MKQVLAIYNKYYVKMNNYTLKTNIRHKSVDIVCYVKQELAIYNKYYVKMNNYTSRTNRRHKSVDIVLISK